MVLSTAVIGVGSVGATTASGTPTVDASTGNSTYTVGGSGVTVDPAIVVSDTSGGTYDGARVVIQNLEAGDQLAFTAQHGISGSYEGSSGVLTLTGTATAVEYQTVFRSVTYSSSASSPDLSDRRVTFSLGTSLPSDDNGHFYEYVDAGAGISWHDANASANAQTYFGLQGYLVTVTSQAENDFVAEKIQGNTWIGASDDAAFSYISDDANGDDRWHWVTGPEAGTHFWTGGTGTDESVNQAANGGYANWVSGEPNDAGGDGVENYAHFWYTLNSGWNDLPGSTTNWVDGYVVEYGGLANDPAITWSDTKTVAVDETPVVITSAGDTAYLLGDPATVVDAAIIADDDPADTFDGARVVIQNLHPNDVLAFTAQHGITGSYEATSGVLTLSGTATAAEYQDVFRSVTFANADPTADVTDRRITFALGSTLPSDATDHFYEYVSAGGISWHDANAAASAESYLGLQGYLATVTSQAENDFIAQKLDGSGWIGASDDTAFTYINETSEGYDQWHWVTGPEAGTHFWTGDYFEGVSQPVPGEYANWAPNEPNEWSSGVDGTEDYAHFYASGLWNDFPGTANVDGYVVEYGGFGGESEITWQDTKTVNVTAPPTNVAPSISADVDSVSADEGSTATNGGSFSDDDGDAVTLSASIGSVVDNGDGTWSWSFDSTDGPDDSQTVTITAEDGEGATSSVSFDLTVDNVVPSVGVNVDSGNTVYYVDWTAANPSGGTASGVINLPNGDTVSLTFEALNPDGSHAPYHGAQTSGGTNYWNPDSPYISAEVPNAPPDSDILQLSGTDDVTYKVTLSEPIVDPIMAIVSLGSGSNSAVYDFDAPYTIVSQSEGYWGGDGTSLEQQPGDALRGTEGHGTIKFLGTYNTFSWTVPDNEVWHGFTFAIRTTTSLGNTDVQEGETATNSGTWNDSGAGGDGVVVTATGEDGNPLGTVDTNPDGTWEWSFDTSDGPTESQTVTVTATDEDGASSSETFDLTVDNAAPSVSADSASVTVDEGETATNTGTVSDPGADTVTLTASVGTVQNNGDGTWSWSFAPTDGTDDSQTVTITADDGDGGVTTTSFALTVNNVAPSVSADSASVTVNEGQTATNTGSFGEPGDDTVSLSVSVGSITDNGDGTWSWSFDAIDGPTDSQTVTITATDSDGAATTTTFDLTVENVAPVLSADVDDYGVAGSPVTASGSFTDVGVEDTHEVTVDWGDGTTSSATVTEVDGSGTFIGSHAYTTGGFFDVTVTVEDDNGGVDSYTETVTVAHLATIDVKPDSSVNPVNPKAKGVLPVAILNTGDFDLTQVDVSTLRLSATEGGAGAATAHNGHLEDVDDDGDLDLMLHFVNRDIGLTGDTTTVYLSGFMTDGVPIVGTDMVDPVPVGSDDDGDDDGANGNGNGRGNGRGR